MSISVRLAVPEDAPALHRVAALTFPLACTPETPEEEKASYIAEQLSESAFRAYIADPACTLLAAVDDASGDLVGYSMLTAGEPADEAVAGAITRRPTVELSRMYVDPAHHGAGTAGQLMAAALDAAGDTGAAGIWLGVSIDNARANAFYAKHGFDRVGHKQFQIGSRFEEDFVRERPL